MNPKAIPARGYGRDDSPMPILGLGGQSLIQRSETDAPAIELIHRALDLGIRYLDTAPLYGKSEIRIGMAIEHRRQDAFLATKTAYRLGSSARRSLERSLQRLRTDYIDSLQLHCLMHKSEIGTIFGRYGIIRMAEKAKQEGLVRHIGITGHYEPSVLSELLRRYPFDSVLIPVNVADRAERSFMQDTMEAAQESGASVIAMKVMGAGQLTGRGLDPAKLLRYALTWPVTTAIVSCRSLEDLEMNVETAANFVPMTPDELVEAENAPRAVIDECNHIYKRRTGRGSLKRILSNRIQAEAAKWLPGYWHF
ncbi:MAG: aldo/keto reductase [Armatimonadota bacterium]